MHDLKYIRKCLDYLFRKLDDQKLEIEQMKKDIDILARPKIVKDIEEEISILKFPSFIQETILALRKLKVPSTAEEVASITKKSRAVESHYLNILFRSNVVGARRRSKNKIFWLNQIIREEAIT